MHKYKTALMIFVVIFLFEISCSQQQDIFVGDVDMPSLKWGQRQANIQVTNKTEYIKFIVVETEISFTGSYLTPGYKSRSNHFIEPYAKKIIQPDVVIPGNYGKAVLKVVMHDVVDTLDEILPGQKFFEQQFNITFHIPDEVVSYFQEKITLPPRVEEHPYFNNEFMRVLFVLLNSGKSVNEIAEMTRADTQFVKEQIQLLKKERYYVERDSVYTLVFPIISVQEAEESKEIADAMSDSLASIITDNMKDYWSIIDSLVDAKIIPRDSADFVSGASLLFQPFPVVSAFLLWYDLGQKFVTRSVPFLIYDGTDICNAANTQYMYAVQGGDNFNGTHFFALIYEPKTYRVYFADHPPDIKCNENFLIKRRYNKKASWNYDRNSFPEYFIVDTATISPLLNRLDRGADSLLSSTYFDLKKVAYKYGHPKVSYGHRYWFWNLVSTLTLNKLIENDVVQRRGDGHYRFDALKKTKK